MIRERASAELQYKTTGLGDLEKAALGITGLNQALEITRKVGDAAEKVLRAAFQATKAFIDTGSQFERYTVQFTTLLGSADAAHKRMEELFRFASTTPFQLPDVVEAAQKLEAYGVYSERALRAAGDAAAAYGKQMNDAVEAVADAAMGEFERLKEFGIKAQHVQQQLGHELVRDTQKGLNEIRDAVIEIFEARTGGGMQALSETLGGMISNLQDKWVAFKNIVADSEAFATVKAIFGAILQTVNDLFDAGEVERMGNIIGRTLADFMWDVAEALGGAADALWRILAWLLEKKDIWTAIKAYASGQTPGQYEVMEELRMYQRMQRYAGTSSFAGNIAAARVAYEQRKHSEGIWQGPMPLPAGAAAAPAGGLAGESFAAGPGAGSMAFRPIEFYDAIEAKQDDTYERMLDREYEQAQETMDAWNTVYVSMQSGWHETYDRLSKIGAAWRKGEKIGIRDLATAWGEGSRQMLATWLGMKAEEWGLAALEHAAAAIGSLAYGNFAAAAKHGLAAAKFAALASLSGIGAGAIGLGAGEGGADYNAIGSAGMSEEGAPDDTRHISRSTGISAQNITYNLYIIHNGTTVYGDAEEFFRGEILPQIQDAQALGVI